jgi:hypothetical protein
MVAPAGAPGTGISPSTPARADPNAAVTSAVVNSEHTLPCAARFTAPARMNTQMNDPIRKRIDSPPEMGMSYSTAESCCRAGTYLLCRFSVGRKN